MCCVSWLCLEKNTGAYILENLLFSWNEHLHRNEHCYEIYAEIHYATALMSIFGNCVLCFCVPVLMQYMYRRKQDACARKKERAKVTRRPSWLYYHHRGKGWRHFSGRGELCYGELAWCGKHLVKSRRHHSLSQQVFWVSFGHPGLQKPPFRTPKLFCEELLKMSLSSMKLNFFT